MVIPKPTSTTTTTYLRLRFYASSYYYHGSRFTTLWRKNVRVSWKIVEKERKGPRYANFTQNSPLMANLLLLPETKRGYFYRSPFLGVRIKSNREVSIWVPVVQLPAVLPTYYQLLLNAETETWIADIQQIFVFNIPFFGWCNRKWVVESFSRCQNVLWVWERKLKVERADKSIQDELIKIVQSPIMTYVQSVFVFGSNQKPKSLVWCSKCVQGYY